MHFCFYCKEKQKLSVQALFLRGSFCATFGKMRFFLLSLASRLSFLFARVSLLYAHLLRFPA